MMIIKDYLTIPGTSSFNQDQFGFVLAGSSAACWVIDGATPIGDTSFIPNANDTSWFVQHVHQELNKLSLKEGTPDDIFKSVIQNVASLYDTMVRGIDKVPIELRPLAAISWIRITKIANNYLIEYAGFADCYAIIQQSNGNNILLNDFNVYDNTIIENKIINLYKQGILDQDLLRKYLVEDLKHARIKQNLERTSQILGLQVDAINNISKKTLSLDCPFHILLASDGFFRIVDMYKLYSVGELLSKAIKHGLGSIYNELSNLENIDNLCLKYPRIKVSDDITALLTFIS